MRTWIALLILGSGLWTACAPAHAQEISAGNQTAFIQDLTRIAQPNCRFDHATKKLFGQYGRGKEIEKTLIDVLFDDARDANTRSLTVWLLTELNADSAREALVRFVESPFPGKVDDSKLKARISLLQNCLQWMGHNADSKTQALLEAWVSKKYWDGRHDMRPENAPELPNSTTRDWWSAVVGFRDSALLGIIMSAPKTSVPTIERLLNTTAADLHPGIKKSALNEAKLEAGLIKPDPRYINTMP